jgi:phosphate transport system substrate-binding protein
MKNSQIIVTLLVSMMSFNAFSGDKKDFGRKNLYIAADPTTMDLLTMVASKVDAKVLKDKPKFEYHFPNKSFLLLCRGQTSNYPDMIATTRAMTADEYQECQRNNAGSIIKLKIGYEAMVVVADKKAIDLDLDQRELFLALARNAPDLEIEGVVKDNFYKTWKDIDSDAAKQEIKIFGPASGTRDARTVGDIAMEGGCRTYDWIVTLDTLKFSYRQYREICHKQRKDGQYIEAATADTDITKQLLTNKNSIGLMSFNDWLESKSKLKAYAIDDLPPTLKTISKGLYPLSRSLYVYIKAENLHKLHGLSHIMNELLSDEALGAKGYLAEIGLVAMPANERKREVGQAAKFKNMPKPEES